MEKKKIIALYCIAGISFIINFILLRKSGSYLLCLLFPATLAFAYYLIFYPQKLLFLSVFLVPLSIPLSYLFRDLSFNVDLPTEPIFVSVLIIFIVKQILDKNYDITIFKHPISIAIFLFLSWQFITIFTSSMPIVSLKAWISNLWFIVPFYFILIMLFKKEKNIYKFLWLYVLGFTIVISISLFKHVDSGFIQKTAHSVMNPFYNDHTSYGAALAMYLPVLTCFVFNKKITNKLRVLAVFASVYFVLALILSYTRAAWLSLFASFFLYIILKFNINFKFILLVAVVFILTLFSLKDQILQELETNKQDSSSNFTEHLESMTNIATDASNLERINRWKCAIRMFQERPIAGWGPGTYQFNYAPFQTLEDKTIISTNFGDRGNAHSEYLGQLSEAGLPGLCFLLVLFATIWFSGVKAYKKISQPSLKSVLLSVLIGLSTYFIHALMNNFLDIDKIAVPFWGMAAIVVALDIYSDKFNAEELPVKDNY